MTQQTQEQRQKLRQQMEKHLELGDVKRLCFDLGVDYENLAGVTKGEKVIALLDHCDRRNKQSPLLLWLRQQHSHVSWQLTLTHDPNNPYKGLFAFQEADANRFFGREAESQRLEETVLANRFTAVVGSSGSGKSSLVLAGLLPRLGRRGNWHIAQLRPEKTPLLNLAHALVPMLQPDTDAINEPARARELAGYLQSGSVPLADYVHQLQATNHHLLLIIDQFEELYTQVSDGEQRHRFLDLLLAALQAEDGQLPGHDPGRAHRDDRHRHRRFDARGLARHLQPVARSVGVGDLSGRARRQHRARGLARQAARGGGARARRRRPRVRRRSSARPAGRTRSAPRRRHPGRGWPRASARPPGAAPASTAAAAGSTAAAAASAPGAATGGPAGSASSHGSRACGWQRRAATSGSARPGRPCAPGGCRRCRTACPRPARCPR